MPTQPVMDGYIRVSQVAGRSGDRFQSPAAQRESIEGWAQAHGVMIAAFHEDLDRSGGTMDRPGMNAAIARVEQGVTGGIIVARLDRFARSVIGGLTTIEELHKRGARVVSVAESIDPATPMGRAMLGLLLIMAAWQRDQADEALAGAQQRAASAGRFPGKPSYGYVRDVDGLTFVDTEAAAVVVRIFTLRAAGRGWRTIADTLIKEGIPTPRGGPRWAPSTLAGIIHSEAYLGVFVGPRGLRVEDAWPPLVDRTTWEAANERRGVRDDTRHHQDRLLAGIARCANCRNIMVRTVNPHGFVSYACRTVGCKVRPSVGAHLLDAYARNRIDERLARAHLQPRPADDDGEAERLRTASAAATAELEAWRDDTEIRTALGDPDYRAGLLARARARDDAVTAEAQHRATSRVVDLAEVGEGGSPRIEDEPWEVQREVAEVLLHSVWVRPSPTRGEVARRHVARRVLMVWADDREHPSFAREESGPLSW